MANSVIIVAGGSGKRFGTELPKQFVNLNGVPILMRTIQVFFDFDPSLEIVVVLPETQINLWETLCQDHQFTIQHQVVLGGSERFYSVKNGLKQLKNRGIVAVHDAVRPLVSPQTILHCFATALREGNAIPVVPIADSLRAIKPNGQNEQVNRQDFCLVQTPQCFRYELITQAFEQAYSPEFTDDASVVEKSGQAIHLVEGNGENIKITNPIDLVVCEALLAGNRAE